MYLGTSGGRRWEPGKILASTSRQTHGVLRRLVIAASWQTRTTQARGKVTTHSGNHGRLEEGNDHMQAGRHLDTTMSPSPRTTS